MNYYERHIGDYLKDTAHLSLLEHGIYSRLMDVYYTRECAIPDADAPRLIGARTKEERAALAAVLAEFFVREESGDWVQMRCEREIDRFKDKQRKAKASADARWGAQRSQSDCNAKASADAMRTHSEGNADGMPRAPVPSPQTPDTRKRAHSRKTPLPDGFVISERVRTWATDKGHGHLDEHLEGFLSYAKRSGAKYADWDEALMTAVRENWAKVNGKDRGSELDEMFRRGRA